MTVERDGSRYEDEIREAAGFLSGRLGPAPPRSLVLGSGLGKPVSGVVVLESVPFGLIPFFPPVSVEGHEGEVALAVSEGERFCCLRGRAHFYEGAPLSRVVFPVRVLAEWGVDEFVLTNAAGAVRAEFAPGELMLIRDHINLMGDNPLAESSAPAGGDRFADMTFAYSPRLLKLARRCALRTGIPVREGVYAALKGPSYETPAEIRMLRAVGVDAVGMSTVPEVIALRALRREVLAISLLTNRAAGAFCGRLDHGDVLRAAEAARDAFWRLLLAILKASGSAATEVTGRFDGSRLCDVSDLSADRQNDGDSHGTNRKDRHRSGGD
jgi:purine-nucleoside phosphorylase